MLRVIAPLALCFFTAGARAEFVFHDGDTVAFLGDSITAARGYTKIVEHYTLMRFPERKVRFINAGKGGDTASGCLERLERDVFGEGATVVTVALGVNDIGWGMKATEENKQRYLDGIRTIIERCRERKVRPIICSPAITAEAPDKAENGFLQKMADEGLTLAKTLGVETVDIQRGMREVQRRVAAGNAKVTDPQKHVRLHAADGVHLTDLGQLAMAYAILKGLGAPQEVSTAVIDAENATVVSVEACAISEITKVDGGIQFVRADRALPLTLGAFAALDFRWVPVSDEISRYVLTLKNLPPGDYQIRAEGRLLGKVNVEQLARGINLANMTADPWQPGGPWDAQSVAVKELVDARDKLWMSGRLSRLHLNSHPQLADLIRQNKVLDDQLVMLQRALAKPQPYHFTVTKVERAAEAEAADKTTN